MLGSPAGVPFQGFLTDAGGIPLGTGSPVAVNVTFRFWDAAAGGNLLYTEVQGVSVSEGVFHANLSPPATLFNGLPRYLGLSVEGGAELTPRTEILSTPYSRVTQTLSGSGTVTGELSQATGFTEFVDNTSDEEVRRYYLTGGSGSGWDGRSGRLIIAAGGQFHPGTGVITVKRGAAVIATLSVVSVGNAPWTYIVDVPALTNSTFLYVLARCDVAGVPLAIRSVTLETASVEQPGPPMVAFHAYNSDTDTGLPGGWNKIEGDAERYDFGGNYDTTLDRFVVPEDGLYHFTNQVSLNALDDNARFVVALWVNGSIEIYTDGGYANTTGSFQVHGGSATLLLSAGDYVESWSWSTDASYVHYFADIYTWFSGYQITTTTTTPITAPTRVEAVVDPEDESRR